jgi:hypothetical protein
LLKADRTNCMPRPEALPLTLNSVTAGECLLKADLNGPHVKAENNCGIVRGTPGPPGPAPKPSPSPPTPAPPPPAPLPPGSPAWELVEVTTVPVIGPKHSDVRPSGFSAPLILPSTLDSCHAVPTHTQTCGHRVSTAKCARGCCRITCLLDESQPTCVV